MKNRVCILIFFFFYTIQFFSCSNEAASNSNTNVAKTSFELNNDLIVADESNAVYYTNAVAGGKYIDVFVTKAGQQLLELHFPASIGTYPCKQSFNSTTSWLTYNVNGGLNYPDDFFDSVSGVITITTLDLKVNKIRGTFYFVGNNSTEDTSITKGVLVVNTLIKQ